MEQTYLYQIGIIYFSDNIKRIQNTLAAILENDGYRVKVWNPKKTSDEDENAVDLYDFVRNQCEYVVLIVSSDCSMESLFWKALQMEIQQKKLDEKRDFLVIECGGKIPLEFKTKVTCLDGSEAYSAELAMQIEYFFFSRQTQKKEAEREHTTQNVVIAGVIEGSKFF